MNKQNKMAATLKAAALIGLVENGIIRREENGDIDTGAFESFWQYFERQLDTAVYDALSKALGKEREEERKKRTNNCAEQPQ